MHIVHMKLQKYMELNGVSDDDMAKLLRRDRTMIGRYRRGEVIPTAQVIHDIQRVTKRAVRFDDWFPHRKSSQAAS